MRILMPSIVDPNQQLGGAWTVTGTIVRMLQGPYLQAEVDVIAVPRLSRSAHRIRQVTVTVKSFMSALPAKIEFTRTRGFLAAVVQQSLQTDLVIVNGADLAWLLPYLPADTPRVLIVHNIEHALFASQTRGWATHFLAGPIVRRQHRRLETFEDAAISGFGNVICLSTLDREYAGRHCGALRTMFLPPCFDSPSAPSRDGRILTGHPLRIGMLGNFSWWPNREGFHWFMREVWPGITPHVELHLFGPDSVELARGRPLVSGHGRIEDLDEVWRRCDFMICPVISGGGVSVKFAEAIYNGVPVLATRFAARGLPLDPDPSIVLLDRPQEWAAFLSGDGARQLAARTAPRSIGELFDARRHAGNFAEFITASCRSPQAV